MKKAFLFAALIFSGALGAPCQDTSASISTSTTDSARFEIIQPAFGLATFRLDKFTGNVHRLGNCVKDDTIGSDKCWKEMIVIDLPKAAGANRPRFQIFTNGSLKIIVLMQIETGQTWQFGLEPADKWHPFIECPDKTDRACLWRPIF